MKKLLMTVAAAITAAMNVVAETSPKSYDEIDITKAVREAGAAGKPVLEPSDGSLDGYTVDNAFGCGDAKADRILLKSPENKIKWTIADSFRAGQQIVVTRYAIRRAITVDGQETPAKERAPTSFRLEGSSDGTLWVPLDERSGVDWLGSGEELKSFDIDPMKFGSYRHYRFVTLTSNANPNDAAKCSFQFVNLFGLMQASVDYLVTGGGAASTLDFTPTLDSKIELDVAFTSLSGMVALFAANKYDEGPQFSLFYDNDNGGRWIYYYGETSYESPFKAYVGARYKIVVEGPVVTVNEVKIIDAGERLTASAARPLSLFASLDAEGKFVRLPSLSVWSVKAMDVAGKPVCDLRPTIVQDGYGCLYDNVNRQFYAGLCTRKRLVVDYRTSKDELDVTAVVRETGVDLKSIVKLNVGTEFNSTDYPYTNLFTPGTTTNDRWLMKTVRNDIQYDIPDSFRPGEAIILTRYAILPCVGQDGNEMLGSKRAPTVVELKASKDGGEPWVTLYRCDSGLDENSYRQGDYVANGYGFNGVCLNIPENNRGDYRHYRFITENSSQPFDQTCPLAMQELRLFGVIGGGTAGYEPVEYVQNANEHAYENPTYFKTGVVPRSADLTVDITGEFTTDTATMGLFCCRGANSDPRSWTLFYINKKLRLDCGSTGAESDCYPRPNELCTIKVVGNRLFVDENEIYTSGTTGFIPGSELLLLASHNALGNINNQARFKLHSCKITDPLKGVVRDYIPVKRTSDGVAGLFDRVNAKFVPSSGSSPKMGAAVDADFSQGGRSLTLENEPAEGEQLPASLEFSFGENQILPEGLYAAFDNKCHIGTSPSDWAKVVKITDVTSGVDSFSVKKLQNEEHYKYVKFFLCDELGYGCACTKTFKARNMGLFIVVR